MEELRSTEVLDHEILEDARKKALRTLKTADDTITAQRQDWTKKTNRAVESIRKAYAEKLTKTKEEIFARLPLDKRQLRSEVAEGLLNTAMDDFLGGLKRETLLSILQCELLKLLETCAEDLAIYETEGINGDKGPKGSVTYSGMELSEAKGLLEKVLETLGGNKGYFLNLEFLNLDFDGYGQKYPSIVVDTQTLKVTTSVKKVAADLLKEKRAELAEALLGEGVLND